MRYNIVFKLNVRQPKFLQNTPSVPTAKTFKAPYTYVHPDAINSSINPTFPPQNFNGTQLLNLYNVLPVPVSTGKRQVKIAVIIAYTYTGLLADLKIYWQNPINFGPESTPPKVIVYTMPGATFNSGWAQEECLDLQMICTMNPNAAIYVVEAKSDKVTDLMAAINYANTTIQPDVISMSWGIDDSTSLSPYNSNFNNPNISYCAASGDANNVSWPSVLSNCISVGGSTLIWTPQSSNPRTEYTWNGAGCGYAASVAQPSYQLGITNINHVKRAVPDLCMVGNQNTGVYVVYKGQWYSFGGTSVSTPLFAGILSLANQQRFNVGKSALTTVYSTSATQPTSSIYVPPSNNVQQFLYKTIYPSNKYKNDFYDVTIGSDQGSVAGNSAILTTYIAGTGFDLTTGLGSPNCSNLCNDLATI
uniref:Peptidase S53 domain-containing protein n=1 Tax=viral metagenome TaxID=1070528 RepID=A0A6C0JF69_9ZZZZ